MLKNITLYANERDYQTSDLSFLLSGLAFLETRQLTQKPWHTVGGQLWERSQAYAFDLGSLLLCSGRSKVLPTYLPAAFSPPAPFLTPSSYSPKFRQVRLLLAFLHRFLCLLLGVFVVLSVFLPLKCNLPDGRDDFVVWFAHGM